MTSKKFRLRCSPVRLRNNGGSPSALLHYSSGELRAKSATLPELKVY
jgi:hypothetical protein